MTQEPTADDAWDSLPPADDPDLDEQDAAFGPDDEPADEPDEGMATEGGPAADPFAAMHRVDPMGAERLRCEWGADFDANVDRARQAAAAIADDELIAVLEETGLGDDPRILRAAARIGALIEQRSAPGMRPDGAARAALEGELDRLMAEPDYWTDRVQQRVRRIHLDLHGGGTVPVHRRAGDAGGLR